MKNKTLKILFSFFLLTLVLFSWQSCNTEFDYDNMLSTRNDATEQANQPNFTIEEVQSWYGTINNKTTNRPQKVKGIKSVEDLFYSEPDWNNYCTNETKNYSVIDIDLTLQMQNDLFLDEHKEAYDKNPDWRYLHSYTRMVVLKSKKQDKKTGFLMTLIPSVEYIKNHKDKIRKTTYVKREKDYDGYILFHELNGTFANGWKYKDGKITAAIKEHSGNTDNNNSLIRLWNTQASYTLAKPHKTSIRRVKRNSEEELDGGELKEVVVIGKKKKDPWDDTTSRWLEEDWNNLNRPGVGNNDFPYPENSNSGGSAGGYTGKVGGNTSATANTKIENIGKLKFQAGLSLKDKKAIERAYDLMMSNCIYEKMVNNYLFNNDDMPFGTIGIDNKTNVANSRAYADYVSNSLYFISSIPDEYTTTSILRHELFHLYQKKTLLAAGVATDDIKNDIKGMLEFERIIFRDLIIFQENPNNHTDFITEQTGIWVLHIKEDIPYKEKESIREQYIKFLENIIKSKSIDQEKFDAMAILFGEYFSAYEAGKYYTENKTYQYEGINYTPQPLLNLLTDWDDCFNKNK